ncbi:hypothetical protein JCM11641_007657 [Rhodosporidiobolus odoratus]
MQQPLTAPSPFFASRPTPQVFPPPPPPPPVPPPPQPAAMDAAVARPLKSDDMRYYEPQEKMVLSFDLGNSFCSVTLTHLRWGSTPLSTAASPSNNHGSSAAAIRTVLTFPHSSPAYTPVPSRMPSILSYDREDRPRAIGAECLLPDTERRAKEEGWIVVRSFKEQMRPTPTASSSTSTAALSSSAAANAKKLSKNKLTSGVTSNLRRSSTPSAQSLGVLTPAPSTFPNGSMYSAASLSSEGLLDAVDAKTEVHGPSASSVSLRSQSSTDSGRPVLLGMIDGGSGALSGIGSSVKEKKQAKVHHGPRLRDIYGDLLKHLVACARAYFTETTPNGEATFLRLWPSCVFVVAHPSTWTSAETDLIRESMEKASLLPRDFRVGRLIFVKESAAITYFARRHTRDAERTWLQENQSFALCDAAEFGVSIIGYTVSSLVPKLKLRAYEPVSRLPAGAHSVLLAFNALLTSRMSKTKFKAPHFSAYLLDEFRAKILPKFTGLEKTEFRLRIQPEVGSGGEAKAEKGIDTGAKVRDGWMTLTVRDVENCFKPSIDAIIVRLSSTLPRGGARHILLSGGFGESPYLVRRLKETFEPVGTALVIPDIPTHTAVSEGALRFYLSETLRPRKTKYALGVQTAVDWRTTTLPGAHERELYEGSGGRRLVLGKWGEVVPRDGMLDPARPWRKTFNFRYRLAARNPIFSVKLFLRNAPQTAEPEEALDGWMTGLDGKTRPDFHPICDVSADLFSLVALSKVHGEAGQEWVQLQVDLVVYVGDESLEAAVVWQENDNEIRGPPSRIAQELF